MFYPVLGNFYFNEKGKSSNTPFKNTMFSAINISTPSKGPIYTLVKGDGKLINKELTFGKVRMNYYISETPIDEEISFETYADFSSSDPHGFYPLIMQIMHINEFLENQSEDDHRIYLDQVYFNSRARNEILSGEFSDKKLRKMIESFGIMTDMSSIVGKNSFIHIETTAKFSKYTITNELPQYLRFGDQVMLCFPEIETGFLIHCKLYEDLLSLNEVTISVVFYDKMKRVHKENLIEEIGVGRNVHSYRCYHAITLDQIIRLFIYVPQMIRIERILYDVDTTIEVILEKMGKTASLTIKKEEYNTDLSLFHIVQSMLSIMR